MDQQEINNKMNNIMMELANIIYHAKYPNNETLPFEVTLEFDNQQRISNLIDTTNNNIISITPNLFTTLNNISTEILNLPEIYKLKLLKFVFNEKGELGTYPEYRS